MERDKNNDNNGKKYGFNVYNVHCAKLYIAMKKD